MTHVHPRSCKVCTPEKIMRRMVFKWFSSHTSQLLERKLTRSRVEFLKKTLERAKNDYFAGLCWLCAGRGLV